MSWLRLGVLISTLNKPLAEIKDWWVCDVGSGNGKFAVEANKLFNNVREYDLSGSSISSDELYSRHWDVIFKQLGSSNLVGFVFLFNMDMKR